MEVTEFEDLTPPPSPTRMKNPPPLVARFLHGGPSTAEEFPIFTSKAVKEKHTSWRAFTDEEHDSLEEAWWKLTDEEREEALKRSLRSHKGKDKEADENDGDSEGKKNTKERSHEVASPDDPPQLNLVPVGLDYLFSVDLLYLELYPVFWTGNAVRVQRATWFYPSTSSSRFFPCDPLLSQYLEEGYHSIKPYLPSYIDELRSALEFGESAESKLKYSLAEDSDVEVIYQSSYSARLYSKGLTAKFGKMLMTAVWGGSGGRNLGHSGGTLVVRGWDNAKAWRDKRARFGDNLTKAEEDELRQVEEEERRRRLGDLKRGRRRSISELSNESRDSSARRAGSPREKGDNKGGSWFNKLGNFGRARAQSLAGEENRSTDESDHEGKGAPEEGDKLTGKNRNTTMEAMTGAASAERKQDEGVNTEVDELVLVIHGIGQKIAAIYESFSFIHAVNQLRALSTKQSTSPSLIHLTQNRRVQYIPILWRRNVDFESAVHDEDGEEEKLDNRFGLEDIEIKGGILGLKQVLAGVIIDVPYYLSHHKDRMINSLIHEANRVYRLFCLRNPYFSQKPTSSVSIIAHSLGSALATDILSNQPTFVPPLHEMSLTEQRTTKKFVFNVSKVFFVGSPVGFFFHMNRAQLIARKGRKRTKNAPKDVALDRAGRYGCMAIDSLYNVYYETDPIAYCLNATVDINYAKLIKPIAIPSTTQSLLSSFGESVSKLLDYSTYNLPWGRDDDAESSKDGDGKEKDSEQKEKESEKHATEEAKQEAKPLRPGLKKLPTELGYGTMKEEDWKRLKRAEMRFFALNPQGCIDFYLPYEGYSQYIDMLSSHANYWGDPAFSTFVLTQLFAKDEDLVRSGRDMLGS